MTTTCGSVVIIGETARRRLPGITEFLTHFLREECADVTTTCGSVVIIGETARKRLPGITEFLIDAGFAKAQYILCSQPRRIAAVTVATYMARQSIITTSVTTVYRGSFRSSRSSFISDWS